MEQPEDSFNLGLCNVLRIASVSLRSLGIYGKTLSFMSSILNEGLRGMEAADELIYLP